MVKVLKKIFGLTLCSVLAFGAGNVFAAENSIKEFSPKVNISNYKEWSVDFNLGLDPSTVNNNNIIVTDKKGNKINAYVRLDSTNNKTIKVTPKVEGYLPGNIYYINVNGNVKSVAGRKLNKTVKMKFTTLNKYLDSSNYEDVPKITQVKIGKNPIKENQYQTFNLGSTSSNVQYRIYVSRYVYGADKFLPYEEITKGYTSSSDGKITPEKYFKAGTNGNKYKVLVYVKRDGVKGVRMDENTDFDNYYVDYFRCIQSSNMGQTINNRYNYTLESTLKKQMKPRVCVTDEGPTSWVGASRNQIKYYLNPGNFVDNTGRYMFLNLNYKDDSITAQDLNNILKGKGILNNKGEAFLEGAKKNNINPVYLVSHAIHETGYGTSKLATGIEVDGEEGKKITYNMYGIQAFDHSADKSGSQYAYKEKWFTPEKAIIGGAKWIAQRYVNNPKLKRETLYKMRWNPYTPGANQYATDIGWAFKQVTTIKQLLDQCKKPVLHFEFPIYK